jgi:hypothetical protein
VNSPRSARFNVGTAIFIGQAQVMEHARGLSSAGGQVSGIMKRVSRREDPCYPATRCQRYAASNF